MAGLRLSMGKTIIIAALALLLNACATQEVKTNPQPQQPLDTEAAMECEEHYRYPLVTRAIWRDFRPKLTLMLSDCFETGEAWRHPLAALFFCPFFSLYSIYGAFLYSGASIGLMATLDLMLAIIPFCPPIPHGPQQVVPNPAPPKKP